MTCLTQNTMSRTVCACQPLRSTPEAHPWGATALTPVQFRVPAPQARPFRRLFPTPRSRMTAFFRPQAPIRPVRPVSAVGITGVSGESCPSLQIPDEIRQIRESIILLIEPNDRNGKLIVPFGKHLPKGPAFRHQRRMAGFGPPPVPETFIQASSCQSVATSVPTRNEGRSRTCRNHCRYPLFPILDDVNGPGKTVSRDCFRVLESRQVTSITLA